jgi:hypothetical protein
LSTFIFTFIALMKDLNFNGIVYDKIFVTL